MSTRLLVTECFDGNHAACKGYNGPADNPNFNCDCDCHKNAASTTDSTDSPQVTEELGANRHTHQFGIVCVLPEFGHSYRRCVDCLLSIHLADHDPATCALCSRASVVAPREGEFVPPAEDALHVAICQAVQEHHGPTANAILREALNNYKPTQLTRTELIRVQQRSGSGEVTAVMLSPSPSPVSSPVPPEQKRLCALCGHNDLDVDGVTCAAPVPICSDDHHGIRHCDCKCVFPEPTYSEGFDDAARVSRVLNHVAATPTPVEQERKR